MKNKYQKSVDQENKANGAMKYSESFTASGLTSNIQQNNATLRADTMNSRPCAMSYGIATFKDRLPIDIEGCPRRTGLNDMPILISGISCGIFHGLCSITPHFCSKVMVLARSIRSSRLLVQ